MENDKDTQGMKCVIYNPCPRIQQHQPIPSYARDRKRSQRANIDALSADGNSGVVVDDILAVLTDLVPVDNVPPVADVLGPAVLVLEVVRVLPDIDSKDGEHDLLRDALHERVVLVGSADELELVTGLVDADPDPA